jgi:ferrochelatase
LVLLGRKCLLLLSYGGPRNPEEIEPFVLRVTSNRATPEVLRKARERYLAIGGYSPVVGDTEALALKLSQIIEDFSVGYGFRFTEPTVEDVVAEKLKEGFKEFRLFAFNPFYSDWSVKGYLEPVKKAVAKTGIYTSRFFLISDFYTEESYLNLWIDLMRKAMNAFVPDRIVFTTHSLPLDDAGVSVYESQFKIFAKLIAEKLGLNNYLLAYQSRGQRGNRWLEPDIATVIQSLDRKEKILVVPAGFLQENLETLYDLDLEVKNLCEKMEIAYQRTGTPLTHIDFPDVLKGFLKKDHLWAEVKVELV